MSEGFEAKKHAYRQTQDGIVVSFVIHPNDMPKALAVAALGTRYMIGVEEIGDDEKPIEPRADGCHPDLKSGTMAASPAEHPKCSPRETAKPKRKFDELGASEQAGILCKDQEFIRWATGQGAVDAADYIRRRCHVQSRSYLTRGNVQWQQILRSFREWQTDQKYADVLR